MPTLKNTACFVVLGLLMGVGKVRASCEVTPTNIYLSPGVSTAFQISVKNTGENAIAWVKIPVDNSAVISSIEPEIVGSGWEVMFSAEADIFINGRIEPGDTTKFNIRANTSTDEDNFDWFFETSIYSYGSSSETCNPINITTMTNPPMPSPTPIPLPVISEMTVAGGPTSATIGWRSDVDASGSVEYGTSSDYGSTSIGASSVQSHSVTLSGLSPLTTYHYRVSSGIESGTTITTDNTFVTAEAGSTTTVTNTVTTISTQTVNKTTVLADTARPTVMINSLRHTANGKQQEAIFDKAPIIEGKVVDTGTINVGIVKIQYSTDGGKNWLLIDEPSGASKASFSFVPEIFDDGNYDLIVRAIDKSGNTGISSKQILIIDRLSPRIIHSIWRVGPIVLSAPYVLISGVPVQVSVQAIGGVTELSLWIDKQEFVMTKNRESGLWEGEISVGTPVIQYSSNPVMVKAIDGGGNKIEQEISRVVISKNELSPMGQKSIYTIYRFDENIKKFKVWNGPVYGQNNPVLGKNVWYLPIGKYYVTTKSKGYQTGESLIFENHDSRVVEITGEAKRLSLLNFWKKAKLDLSIKGQEPIDPVKMIGKQITWIDKTELRGQEVNLSIVPSFDPRLASILSELNSDDVVVLPGSNQSSVDLLKSRGGYLPIMIADPDGIILEDLKGKELPLELQINRQGVVEQQIIK